MSGTYPSTRSRIALMVALVAVIALAPAAATDAAKRVTCGGQRATVVGTQGTDVFDTDDLNTGDVVATLGGGDSVLINDMRNVAVCLGKGSDSVDLGSNAGPDIIINGGPGGDGIRGSHAEDPVTLRGQNGSDGIYGGGGNDRIVAGT